MDNDDRDYLCGYLLDGMDQWFERIGSQNSKNDYNLIGCKNQIHPSWYEPRDN